MKTTKKIKEQEKALVAEIIEKVTPALQGDCWREGELTCEPIVRLMDRVADEANPDKVDILLWEGRYGRIHIAADRDWAYPEIDLYVRLDGDPFGHLLTIKAFVPEFEVEIKKNYNFDC